MCSRDQAAISLLNGADALAQLALLLNIDYTRIHNKERRVGYFPCMHYILGILFALAVVSVASSGSVWRVGGQIGFLTMAQHARNSS